MKSGITLEEIKRLFNYLEENKTNDKLQIIMTTEGCRSLYELFIDFNKYQKILENRINKAIEYIHNNQPVFELSSKEQLQEWFEKEYYVELLKILKGE